MKTIGERIRTLRENKNITQTELAEIVGAKTYTTISKWESDDNFPKGKDIKVLADFFNVTSDYLLGLNEENISKNSITSIYNQLDKPRQNKVYSFAELQLEEQNKIIEFPKKINVLGQTAAGAPVSYGDPDIEEKEFKTVPKGAQYALNVKGDSMEPLIPNGSIIFYKEQQNVESGEIAILEIDGDGVTCKKVYFNYEDNKIILRSLNDKYEDIELDGNQVRVIGKVVL